jgi:S1-C subfamily serine protease
MSIALPCPSCRASLNFADTLLGRTVKCKECGSPVEVKAPVAKAKPVVKKVVAAEPVEDDDEPVRPRKKLVTKQDEDDDDRPRRKPAKKTSSRRDDDDEEDAPKKSMMLPIAIVGGVLVLIVGGVLAAMTMGGGGKEKDVAVAPVVKVPETKPKPVITPPTTPPAPETTETASNPPTTTVEPPPVKKVEPVAPPVRTPSVTTKRPTRETPDPETMDKMMKASVYIEVEDGRGSGGSGSGWLGIEPNLIITNAHVLGMKAPNSPAPKKITCFLNAGQKGSQIEIPHAKMKLLAVDRDMDLAVLEVINMKLPEPLTVRPTQQLGILEKLVALGYPGGRRLSKNNKSTDPPAVTVSQTQVQSFRNDDDGNLNALQVQGGIVHGNSGGPLCDADGNCIGVAVRVDLDREGRFTNIAYGVPTEYVTGLLAGRIANVEYGQAYNKDGKVAIPVTVRCLDPRKRLAEVGLAYWIGDNEPDPRKPGPSHNSKPADSGLQEMKLAYNPGKQEATGELIFPPTSGARTYWCQPYYQNVISPKYFMGGNSIKLKGSPVDLVPADLTARYKVGTRRTLTLDYTRNITEFEEGEEVERSERRLRNWTYTLNEQVLKAPDAQSVAGLQYGFKSWEFKVIEGDDSVEIPKDLRRPLEAELQNTTLTAKINRLGALTQTSFRPNGAQLNPMIPQEVLVGLGTQAFDALSRGSIPLPGKSMTAGESWPGSADITIKVRVEGKPAPKGPKGPNPTPPATPGFKEYKAREVKYTYLGLRDHGGKKEIVVQIEGTVQPAKGTPPNSASGSVKGFARIDEATGVITESEIKHEFEIDSSEKGVKKRISGIEDYKLSRSPAGS